MSTLPAPLLTPEQAQQINLRSKADLTFFFFLREELDALQALADGRTACVDAIELKRLKRIDQAYPQVSAFYMKHAVGQKLAPSCFCCGQLRDERAVTHAELPDVFVCKTCKDATERVRVMSEDECRAAYRKWAGAADTLYGERAWLACAHAMGAVR